MATTSHADDDRAYISRVNARFAAMRGPLFRAEAGKQLVQRYLESFAPEDRQAHTCSACLSFIRKYGTVCALSGTGERITLWDDNEADVPPARRAGARLLHDAAHYAPIVGAFDKEEEAQAEASEEQKQQPQQQQDDQRHLHFSASERCSFLGGLSRRLTKAFRAAYNAPRYSPDFLRRAQTRMDEEPSSATRNDRLYIAWLVRVADCAKCVDDSDPNYFRVWRDHVWLVVVTRACYVPASRSVDQLLEDMHRDTAAFRNYAERRRVEVRANLALTASDRAAAAARRAAKTQADLEVAFGERVIADTQLLARAIERRVARVDELPDDVCRWRPDVEAPPHRDDDRDDHDDADIVDYSVRDFAHSVLPLAKRIEYLLPAVPGPATCFITTAEHPDAPCIFRWEGPLAEYAYLKGEPLTAAQIGLPADTWVPVAGVAYAPSLGTSSLVMLLENARDLKATSGAAIYSPNVAHQYAHMRDTFEAGAANRPMGGTDLPGLAIGPIFMPGLTVHRRVRVHYGDRSGTVATYLLSAW